MVVIRCGLPARNKRNHTFEIVYLSASDSARISAHPTALNFPKASHPARTPVITADRHLSLMSNDHPTGV